MNYKQVATSLTEQFLEIQKMNIRALPNMQMMIFFRSELSDIFSEKISNEIVSRMKISICQPAWDEAEYEIRYAAKVLVLTLGKIYDVLADEVGVEAANKMIINMSNQFSLTFD